MMNTPYMPFYTKNATVCSMNDLGSIDSGVTHITVSNNCGNENTAASLYFTRFAQLKELVIGNNSCMNVDQLNLIGLSKLRSVVIGENSFTKKKNGFGKESNRRFYVKNCPSLRELRIGRYSFSDYAEFHINAVQSLEEINVGILKEWSYNFYYASLELIGEDRERRFTSSVVFVEIGDGRRIHLLVLQPCCV